ncbi:hypothetical protein [Holdemania massiliensis]|uniref:hypothetical protein n=1 Tax=Holdemania massiliensis TaxID=1468449 RepID=UPI001F06D357|nr:hypothetical protein [Holdemania massiliensis]MCH1940855.1 hypothetical protein [Holdemania massiliensis]
MQTAIQLFQSAWGIQLILLIVWIGVIAVYRQKTLPQRFKMLSQLLVAVTVAMILIQLIAICGIGWTMVQYDLSQSNLFVVNVAAVLIWGLTELAFVIGFVLCYRKVIKRLMESQSNVQVVRDCHRGNCFLIGCSLLEISMPLILTVIQNWIPRKEYETLMYASINFSFEFPSLTLLGWGFLLIAGLVLENYLELQLKKETQKEAEMSKHQSKERTI